MKMGEAEMDNLFGVVEEIKTEDVIKMYIVKKPLGELMNESLPRWHAHVKHKVIRKILKIYLWLNVSGRHT